MFKLFVHELKNLVKFYCKYPLRLAVDITLWAMVIVSLWFITAFFAVLGK